MTTFSNIMQHIIIQTNVSCTPQKQSSPNRYSSPSYLRITANIHDWRESFRRQRPASCQRQVRASCLARLPRGADVSPGNWVLKKQTFGAQRLRSMTVWDACDWLPGWLTGWLMGRRPGPLADHLTDGWTAWLTFRLPGWLANWFTGKCEWLTTCTRIWT